MKLAIACVFVLGLAASACGSDGDGLTPGTGGSASSGSNTGGTSSSGSGSATAGQSTGGKNDGNAGSTSSQAGNAPMTPPGSTPSPMPVISRDVPAFASSHEGDSTPENAQDGDPETRWVSKALPAWLAYDLSAVPAAQRSRVLVAWYAGAALDFINEDPDPDKQLPVDFTIESNGAAGGAAPPTDGWKVVKTVTSNDRNSRQALLDLDGASWLRVKVTKSTSSSDVGIDLDVHSAPDGATDSWLFMGDSITFMSTSYLFSDLPAQVNKLAKGRWPAVIPAGIGGTNTNTALEALDATIEDFPGRFVTLNYGTNDHPEDYQMEELVKRVIAAGKAPVVPHMPWAFDSPEGPVMNGMIDAIYAKYPEVVRGPDFWAIFLDRTDLIPEGDVHPNEEGQAIIRAEWAKAMTR
jgi:hypothetical protein